MAFLSGIAPRLPSSITIIPAGDNQSRSSALLDKVFTLNVKLTSARGISSSKSPAKTDQPFIARRLVFLHSPQVSTESKT